MGARAKADILISFGDRVRALRLKQGLSQEDFAFKCGIDRTYISGIERGRRNPSLRSVERIAKTLRVSLGKLFDSVEGGSAGWEQVAAGEGVGRSWGGVNGD